MECIKTEFAQDIENKINLLKRKLNKNIKHTQEEKDFYEKAEIFWKARIFDTENKTFKKVLEWID